MSVTQSQHYLCILARRVMLVCGLGGAGAFSDGKTDTFLPGWRPSQGIYREKATEALIKYVDGIYLRFGAPDKLYGTGDEVAKLAHRAALAELRLTPVPIRHMGTEHCRQVLKSMRDYLESRLTIKVEMAVAEIVVENGQVTGMVTESGERVNCRYLILSPGEKGRTGLMREANRLKNDNYHQSDRYRRQSRGAERGDGRIERCTLRSKAGIYISAF